MKLKLKYHVFSHERSRTVSPIVHQTCKYISHKLWQLHLCYNTNYAIGKETLGCEVAHFSLVRESKRDGDKRSASFMYLLNLILMENLN